MIRLWMVMLASACLLCAGSAARDEGAERLLRSLDPADPRSYLLAGETLIESEATVSLGRETLAVGALLAAGRDPGLSASMLVAIASVARDGGERHALWSLAVDLDPARGEDRHWFGAGEGADEDRRRASGALALLRTGSPDAADRFGRDAETRALVVAEGQRLGHSGATVGAELDRWVRHVREDPCRGRMVVRVREGGAFVDRPCPDPSRHHGVRIDGSWAMMVGIELSLAGRTPDSWPAQARVGLDAPVPSWTLADLADAFGVSADRPVRVAGRWSAR